MFYYINGKNFYDSAIDSDIKRYEEIRKLTTGQSEEYSTGCLLDYECTKILYRLILVDLVKDLFGKLKKLDNRNANAESMFVLAILEKIQKVR